NIESKDPAQVITGNERVVRPRLSDAEFFFNTDRKKNLSQMNEPLKNVVFQAQLGTVYEKAERISRLAKFIAHKIGANEAWAERAGLLCKADLSSEMVGEFPELQGIMGMYYARHDNEPEEIAIALNEQYMPRFAGDQLPATHTGAAVAIADKLDTLVGIFGIGKPPSGDKDPFGLRRATLGVLRILIGRGYELNLSELIGHAIIGYETRINHDTTLSEVLTFMQGRYRALFQEEGIAVDTINAVAKLEVNAPLDFYNRIQAVSAFRKLPEAAALAAANKRVANILAKAEGFVAGEVNAALLSEEQEKALAEALTAKQAEVAPLFAKRDYKTALTSLASLRDVTDAFFDKVMVNADDAAIRQNRLNLLSQLKGLFVQVADISELQG
ncbi:MAG TPA: glycine--tRNA ligase subunit beta, partial [Pseudomonadales bacterium]|nr:glycine--tRNA ligase subunit beta [Pseudomonadales bacterium]